MWVFGVFSAGDFEVNLRCILKILFVRVVGESAIAKKAGFGGQIQGHLTQSLNFAPTSGCDGILRRNILCVGHHKDFDTVEIFPFGSIAPPKRLTFEQTASANSDIVATFDQKRVNPIGQLRISDLMTWLNWKSN